MCDEGSELVQESEESMLCPKVERGECILLRKIIIIALCLSVIAFTVPVAAARFRPAARIYNIVVRTGSAQRDIATSHQVFRRGNESRFGNDVARGATGLTLKASVIIENDSLTIGSATIRQGSAVQTITMPGEIPMTDGVFWGRLGAEINTPLGLEEGAAAVYFDPENPNATVINITIGVAGAENDMAVLLFGEPHEGVEKAVRNARGGSAGTVSPESAAGDVQAMTVPEIIEATHVSTIGTSLLGRNNFKSDPPQWSVAPDGLVNMTNIFDRSSFVNGNGNGYVDVRVFTDTVAVQRFLGRNWNGEWPYVGADEILFRITSPFIGVNSHYPLTPTQKDYTLLGLIPKYGTFVQFFANTIANLFTSLRVTLLSAPGGIEVRMFNLDINADFTYRDRNNQWIPKSRSEEAVSGGAFVRLHYSEGVSGFRPIDVQTKAWYLASVNGSFIWVITPAVLHQWQTNMAG